MKKIFIAIAALMFASVNAFAASLSDLNFGISGQALYYNASGTETLKESNNKTNSDETGIAPIASIFIETETDAGGAVGVEIIPYDAKLGDGSMSSDDDIETAGTNTVDVNLSNFVSFYVENPMGSNGRFLRLALNHGTLQTDETVNTGSTYGDEDLTGLTVGVGVKRDRGNGFFKFIAELSHFQGATFDATNTNNKITLDDFQTLGLRASVGF